MFWFFIFGLFISAIRNWTSYSRNISRNIFVLGLGTLLIRYNYRNHKKCGYLLVLTLVVNEVSAGLSAWKRRYLEDWLCCAPSLPLFVLPDPDDLGLRIRRHVGIYLPVCTV
jgi:hypothetical protein